MKRALSAVVAVLLLSAPASPQTTGPDGEELAALLKQFLAGASRSDPAVHERFWAEDLVYTSAAGRRMGKADILRNLRAPSSPRPATTYGAEDVRIQKHGDAAVVAFRLVGTTQRDGRVEVASYLNTGTFLKRQGRWQAVGWQATRMPRPEDDARKDVAAAEAGFHRAILAGDVKALESLVDGNFIWTPGTGEQMRRAQLVDALASGRLKYAKLETSHVMVAVHGDTAVVRGVSQRQRSSFPGSEGAGDATPFTAFYTLTFANQGDGWKAVAMHSNRPPDNQGRAEGHGGGGMSVVHCRVWDCPSRSSCAATRPEMSVALSYRSPRTIVKESAIRGRGLFAREAIPMGEIVAIKGGYIFDSATLGELQKSLSVASRGSRVSRTSASSR